MKQIVAAVLLLAATAVNGQCNFNDMTVSLGSQTLKGASLAGAGVTVGVVAPLAACTGFVATTSQCTLQAANYNGGVAITVTCTGSTWGPAVLSADPCAAMAPAIANAGTITGNEGDTKPVVCNSGFTCDQATCNVICTANAFTFVTQTPAVTAIPTCIQDCTLLPLAGASLSGCTAGGVLVDMTTPGAPTCTWNMDAGFDCGGMTTGAITCTAGTLAGAPTCTENVCAVYDLGTAPAGLIAGPNQGMVLPCTAMTVLTAVTQPSCSLQCDNAAGYTTNTGLLNCDALNMGTGVVATPSIACAAVQCLQPFDHAAAGIVDPAMTLPSCNNVLATPCSLVCDGNGYAQGGAAPSLQCTQDTTNRDVGNWVLTNPCLGPATCAIYTCPDGLLLDANPTAINCPQVTTGGTPIAAICSALHADNTAACCPNLAQCPAFASNAPTCACDAGYDSNPALPQWSGTAWTHTCSEKACSPFTFPPGAIAGDTDGCASDPITLTTVNDPTCSIKCADGYVAGTSTVTCDITGNLNPPATLSCVEKSCSSFPMPTGATGGDSGTPCSNMGTVLKPVTAPSCSVKCQDGFTGTPATIVCGTSVTNGGAPAGTIDCVQNLCASYAFPNGVVAGGGTGTPCTNNTRMLSGDTCQAQCDTNFIGSASSVSCASDATDGQVVTGGPTCVPTCATFACPLGYDAANAATGCTSSICTTGQCCVAATCPSDSTQATVNGALACNCNAGYAGTITWDASATPPIWTGVCSPVCSNSLFAGCTTGSTLVADFATKACTGPGGCDMTSCTACQQIDCCEEFVCQAPGTTRPEYLFSGGDTCTTVTACGAVSCAVGYSGTPTILCPGTGSQFQLTGCADVACPAGASGVGVCDCGTGYTVTGGGGPVWDPTSRVWLHTCSPTCANTLFQTCESMSLSRIATAEQVTCTTGGSTLDPTTDCTVAQCCVTTCDQFESGSGCQVRGLKSLPNPQQIRCSGPASTDCTESTCCVATCNNPLFTGCGGTGYQAKIGWENIECMDANPTNCNVSTCCDATVCGNYVCPAGQSSKPNPPTCVGACSAFGCCDDNTCLALVATSFPAYLIPGRPGCSTVATCGNIQCATGYRTDGPVGARLTCDVMNGIFGTTGCVENICQPINNLAGYNVERAPTCNTTSSCGTVTCADGYNDNNGMNIVGVRCPAQGGGMEGFGCIENVCAPPNTDLWRQNNVGVAVALPDCTRASDCGAITCSNGYSANPTAVLQCTTPGGEFASGGCDPNICQPPGSALTGYVFTDPTCVVVPRCGTIACDRGFEGTPVVVCPSNGGTFTATGCSPVGCPVNSNGTLCACNSGYTGTPNFNTTTGAWDHVCTAAPCPSFANTPGACVCNSDYTGTLTWTGTAWAGTCIERQCNSRPSSSPGYTITGTCSSLSDCTVTCANGYTNSVSGVAPTLVCSSGLVFVGRGCSPVACPVGSNAGPAGVCTCLSGYTGAAPVFNTATRTFAVTCTAVPCPLNTNDDLGFCTCKAGYTGTPTFVGSQWTHTCVLGGTTDCTALVDTNTQANFCTQQKAQGACTDPGILGVCQRTCCTGTGNLAPTFTYTSGSTTSGPLTFPVSSTGTFSRSAALTNISPVESTQTIVTTNGVVQCSVTSGSNLAGATLRIVGGVGELSFTGPVNSATSGTISCPITDNGSPALTTTAIFPITVGTPIVTPFPPTPTTPVTNPPCNGACLFASDIPQVNSNYRVSVLTGAVVSGKALLTNLHGGIAGEAATVTCSPQTGTASNVFTVLPQVTRTTGDVGLLSFTAGQIVTDVLVTCTAVDSANLQTGFQFVISIGKETDDKIMRLGLVGIVSAFNKALFVQLVQGYLNGLTTTRLAGQIRDVVIYFVCPASACGTTLLTCPVTSTLKIAAGCVRGDDIANARGAALLADANSVVDFTITTANADGTAAKIADVETAQTALNGCINPYLTTGVSCSVSGIGPSDTVTLVEKPIEDLDDDDDEWLWWHWLLLALGILLCCILSCILLYCLLRKKKDKGEQKDVYEQREMQSAPQQEERPAGTYDDYNTTRGSEDYYSSYDPNSYASEVLEFQNDDAVTAQYIDGDFYPGTIWSKANDGTYNIRWADGSHSEGVPPEQIRPA